MGQLVSCAAAAATQADSVERSYFKFATNAFRSCAAAGELHGALMGSGEVNAELLVDFNLFANDEGLKYNDDGTCECITSPRAGVTAAQ